MYFITQQILKTPNKHYRDYDNNKTFSKKKKESKELSIENISMNTRLLHYLKKEKKKKDCLVH